MACSTRTSPRGLGSWPTAVWKGCSRTCTRERRGRATRYTSPAFAATVDLRGRGLVLVPTAFGWPNLGIGPTNDTSVAPPALVYPMLGAARLWDPATRPPAIARLLGAGRAFVLAETRIPSTTGSLAQRVNLAPATVSQHLAVLRGAGLVSAERRGREVLYRQTPLAAALLHANRGLD